jgi:glycerophosphoryl diester phosphodiesterase
VIAVRRPTQIIAHRGASRAEPENTVRAFRRAAAMGADAVELDVRTTADGLLVVHHDAELADGRRIASLDGADLPDGLATLEEALDACQCMWVNVEIKNYPGDPDFDPTAQIADATVAALRARPAGERFLISCFHLDTIDRCREMAADIPTAFLCAVVPDGVAGLLAERGHQAFHPWDPTVTAALIDECHAAGLDVNTWTCDDPERMAELISWGIDGICTNTPDTALTVRDGRRSH